MRIEIVREFTKLEQEAMIYRIYQKKMIRGSSIRKQSKIDKIGQKYLKKMTEYRKFKIYADKIQRTENLLDFIINKTDLVDIMKEFQTIITQSFDEITEENVEQFIEYWIVRYDHKESIIRSVRVNMSTENLDVCLIDREECDNNLIFRDNATTVEQLIDNIKHHDHKVSHDTDYNVYKDLLESESTPKNGMVFGF